MTTITKIPNLNLNINKRHEAGIGIGNRSENVFQMRTPLTDKEDLIKIFRINRMKQMKLERLNKYNLKLKEEIKSDRIKVSNCALIVIDFTENNRDYLIKEVWGEPVIRNRYKNNEKINYNNISKEGNVKLERATKDQKHDKSCCIVM